MRKPIALLIGFVWLYSLLMYSDELVAQVTVSGMTELATTPADDDMTMVLDVSDLTMAVTGTNKKIKVSNLLSGNMSGKAATATALAANPADCALNQFAQSIVASGDLTCSAIADADVPNTITINLAATATALAANGANCGAGSYPLGVDASGASEVCTADDDTPERHIRGGHIGVQGGRLQPSPARIAYCRCVGEI